MVHIDPEDDEQAAPSSGLPLRNEILARLQQRWASIEAARYIEEEETVLHYLDGEIHVEVLLPLSRMTDMNAAQATAHALRQQATEQPGMDHIADVVVRFH